MPKLNVQQNNQNVIQAFKNALAIGRLKGIIASDGNHNFSTAGSNRNLLDNPWFTAGNVVNQRGVATIQHTQYGIDRWKGEFRSATITVTDAGLAYQGTAADLYQPMESSLRTFLNGKTLTASMLKSDGTIESGSAVFTNGANTQFILNSATGADVFISVAGNFNLRYLNRTSAVTVVAVKLELGSVSTLANDAPPEYETELLKCQYYAAPLEYTTYSNPFTGLAASATEFFVEAYLPRSMREISNPTISVTGTAYAIRNGSTGAITAWEAGAIKGNHIRLKGTTTNLTANTQVPVYTAGNTLKIFVSADL